MEQSGISNHRKCGIATQIHYIYLTLKIKGYNARQRIHKETLKKKGAIRLKMENNWDEEEALMAMDKITKFIQVSPNYIKSPR